MTNRLTVEQINQWEEVFAEGVSLGTIHEDALKLCDMAKREAMREGAEPVKFDYQQTAQYAKRMGLPTTETSATQEVSRHPEQTGESPGHSAPAVLNQIANAVGGKSERDKQAIAKAEQKRARKAARALKEQDVDTPTPMTLAERIRDVAAEFEPHTQADLGPDEFWNKWWGRLCGIANDLDASEAAARQEIERLKAEINDLKLALGDARGDTYPAPYRGWQCFHCGEWFRTKESAQSHFGVKPHEFKERADAAEKRAAELQVELAGAKRCDNHAAISVIRLLLRALQCPNAPTDTQWQEIRRVATEYIGMLDSAMTAAQTDEK